MRLLCRSLILSVSLFIFLPYGIFANQLNKIGEEFMVNTYTTATQGFGDIAVGSDGKFVIVWSSAANQDGSEYGIFSQIYDADGNAIGGEFQVNTTTDDQQWTPSVAIDGQGRYIFVWQSFTSEQSFDIFGQRFDSDGFVLGPEFQVSTFTPGSQDNTKVAAAANGDFLIVWESDNQDEPGGAGVFGQLYNSGGAEVGGEIRVNETTADDQNGARVAATDSGYVVVWESVLQDGNGESTVLRFFDSEALPSSDEIVVNTTALGDQTDPDVAVTTDGMVAVVWEDSGLDGSGNGIFGQILDSTGAPLGGEFQVNTYTTGDQGNPRVSADGTGGFVAVWTSVAQLDGTSEDIFGQRFGVDGALIGGELQVNTQTVDDQDMPTITGGPDERIIIMWRAEDLANGSSRDVAAQRYGLGLFRDGFESGDTEAWSASMP